MTMLQKYFKIILSSASQRWGIRTFRLSILMSLSMALPFSSTWQALLPKSTESGPSTELMVFQKNNDSYDLMQQTNYIGDCILIYTKYNAKVQDSKQPFPMHAPVCACISVSMCVCISLCSVCVYVSEGVCMCMCTPWVYISIEAKRGCHIVRFPVAGVTGSCELSNISAGN